MGYLLAILSFQHQTIHFLHISEDTGYFTLLGHVGRSVFLLNLKLSSFVKKPCIQINYEKCNLMNYKCKKSIILVVKFFVALLSKIFVSVYYKLQVSYKPLILRKKDFLYSLKACLGLL